MYKKLLIAFGSIIVAASLCYNGYAFFMLNSPLGGLNHVTIINNSGQEVTDIALDVGITKISPFSMFPDKIINLKTQAFGEGTIKIAGQIGIKKFTCEVGYVDSGYGSKSIFWIEKDGTVSYSLGIWYTAATPQPCIQNTVSD